MADNMRTFADDLFEAMEAVTRLQADAAQRAYAAMTPEERRALWRREREELDRIRAECAAKGLTL